MQIVYSPEHRHHNPLHEFLDGRFVPYHESPQRAEIILSALQSAGLGPVVSPEHFGIKPLLAVHSQQYLTFLEGAYGRWVAAGGALEGVLPTTFAVRGMRRFSPDPLGEPGYYCFDQSAVIVAETYAAARLSADLALTGAALLLNGQQSVYALCRPPGHHAAHDLYGGYCFLNNVAIAAEWLLEQAGRAAKQATIAILDIDFHHGNGTQELFYERDDVLFVSIHADPARHYPYFLGYDDERGAGPGEGFNLNFPLERGVTNERFLAVLTQALEAIAAYAPRWLLVSAGFDTYGGDPIADFALTHAAYDAIGAQIGALGLPTLHIQEGGYAIAALGENVARYLRSFEGARSG